MMLYSNSGGYKYLCFLQVSHSLKMERPKRYRNFILESKNQLSHFITDKERVVVQHERDGNVYYHIGMYAGYSTESIKKLAKCTNVSGVTPLELLEYTHVKNLEFGESKVKKELEKFKEDYEKKLNRGKLLHKVIMSDDYNVDILPIVDRECLRLYTNFLGESEELVDVTLYPWQTDLLKELEKPSERQVIWVYGEVGKEGKTWMQGYIEKQYGSRVYRSVLTNKAENMCYVLSKQLLSVKDIFLFNIARSDNETLKNSDAYQVIEGIKDGRYFSGKYSSQHLRFKTPNTLIIFANKPPDASKLSKDRWVVYEIHQNMEMVRNYTCLNTLANVPNITHKNKYL